MKFIGKNIKLLSNLMKVEVITLNTKVKEVINYDMSKLSYIK